jgi:serine-type D-Ala-D-Ala carboxypeptidase
VEKKRLKKIENLFVTALNNNVFSGAAFAFSKWEKSGYKRLQNYYGFAHRESTQEKVSRNHYFDLASLSKPLATVLVLLSLFEKKILRSDTKLEEVFKICPEDKKKITIRQLMSHRAGFVPHREYFNDLIHISEEKRKKFVLKKVLEENLTVKKGDHCYSDLGFMLLGLIIEEVTGKDLVELCEKLIFRPLGLHNKLIFPCSTKKNSLAYVNTGNCLWSNKQLSGLVHDDNCRAMGSVAGHAGLFGTLSGVVNICEELLSQWKERAEHPAYSNKLLQESLKRVGSSTWSMGFDMVSPQGSSAGKYFSKGSVGHLGFTGTSFWIDPENDCLAVLLTNRVCYGGDNLKIREFRPALHDLLME